MERVKCARVAPHLGAEFEQAGQRSFELGPKLQIIVGDHGRRNYPPGVLIGTGGVETAPGDAAGAVLARGVGDGFGGNGFAIAIKSETMTDLKPLASS